ncbi:MAG: sulfotransferase, partial [Betaproteobacteria bacterium]
RTILMDFIDNLADFDRFGRADILFAKDKAIGAALISRHAVADLPRTVQEHLYFVRFEDLVEHPLACMSPIYAWLGLAAFEINPDRLAVGTQESDSHYHMKYLRRQLPRILKPRRHEIAPRIQTQIESACAWYYQLYYPKTASPP